MGAANIDITAGSKDKLRPTYLTSRLTYQFCMEVRIEKSKDVVTTRKGENTAQEIRLDGKMLDDMNNFQHIGANRIKRLTIISCSRDV